MELKYIEIFCAVVELKSFSKAARSLRLTQPTISIHIKALEDEFSTRLFDRMGRNILPTEAGETLYRYAKEIVRIKEQARLAMDKLGEGMAGRLIIGASTIPGEYILPPLLGRFKRLFPEIVPTLKIGDSGDIHRSVLDGDVDVGIIGAATKDSNIVTKRFLEDELVLVAAADFKDASVDDRKLREIPLLIREEGSGTRTALETSLDRIGLKMEGINVVAEIGSSQALIEAVRSGMGLAFISRISVLKEMKREGLRVVPFKGATFKRHFYIITHRLRYRSRLCKSFIDFLLDNRRTWISAGAM
jgi:DNA-binding transcriptional LysR family regulator